MPDLPIVLPDTAAAPKDYTLSGAQELALKTVRALIDGSGAASPFLPTLQLLDPNGHVMWEGATLSTVAAGGSADVSWFPGLGGQGGSTPPPTPAIINWAYIDSTQVPTNCPPATSTRFPASAGTFYTNAAGMFDAHNSVGGVMGVRILQDGHYMLWMTGGFTSGNAPIAGDQYNLTIEGGGAFVGFGWQALFPGIVQPPVGAVVSGGVMSVGGFITPPTDAIVCRVDNIAGGHTFQFVYTGLLIFQLDDVNHDLT